MTRCFIGLDVSTTGSKALAIDERGAILAACSHPHPLSTPLPLWAEQAPEDWWQAASASLRDVVGQVAPDNVVAVGLTGQMLGLTALDGAGHPVRPAILWNDGRSGDQCIRMTEQVGARWLHEHIGSLLLTGLTAPKIIWLREHEPEHYRQIERILLPKDYVRFRLSGAYVTDVADASGMALLDIARRTWSDTLLDAWDIPRRWLPDLCESPDVCAHIDEAGAAATGLRVGTPIVGGAGDQPAGAIGSGIIASGQTSLSVGTSGVVFTSADRYTGDPEGRMHAFCHAAPGTWCYMGVMLSAAGGLRWFNDELLAGGDYDALNARVERVPRGSAGLLFSPYLTGERHPHPDPLARGAFVGLTLRHGLDHMARAVMEGVAFGLRDTLELLRASGIHPPSAAISGGAVNSPVWRQLMSDILAMPLYTVNTSEGAAYGAAILAGVGGGAWPDVATACAALVHPVDELPPDPNGQRVYDELYAIFRRLYPQLREIYADLSRFDTAHTGGSA